MPFIFSQVTTQALAEPDRCVEDLRNKPIKGRKTRFRLMSDNSIAYTFADFIPGFSSSAVYNTMPYHEFVDQPLKNAYDEGRLFFGADFAVDSNARAKVVGDSFEVVSAAIMWNIAARWNTYTEEGTWPQRSAYQRPNAARNETRQVGVLDLPREYDWVRLLTADAAGKINSLRAELSEGGMTLPTSTPDLAVVVLPETHRYDPLWKTELHEILLGVAFKRSLRSDRVYQPLYEANIMQLLLEGHLGAPPLQFDVYTLEHSGTNAIRTYGAASLYSVLMSEQVKHRAIRELYVPDDAQELARRFLNFLNNWTAGIA
jgi:hypothetical protein